MPDKDTRQNGHHVQAGHASVLVVTGTDATAGKTMVTAAVAPSALGTGSSVAVVKPARTGPPPGVAGDLDEVIRLPGRRSFHLVRAAAASGINRATSSDSPSAAATSKATASSPAATNAVRGAIPKRPTGPARFHRCPPTSAASAP
jgi:dethiobiotin synthetase